MAGTSEEITSKLESLRTYYREHEHAAAILFFICGFLFDAVMLNRIDSPFTMAQQALYMLVIMAGLVQMFFEQNREPVDAQNLPLLKRYFYEYRTPLLHFLFGTLLNGYTLFFFKSSSLTVSFLFMLFMVGLLVINESHRFRHSNLTFKFALLALCFLCFACYVVPILLGELGLTVFLLSMVTGALPLIICGWWIQKRTPDFFEKVKMQIWMPTVAVLIGFLFLFFVKLIPPVPLSIPFIGVYHNVERVDGGYRLSYEKPWWRFWQNGDQVFHAEKGDRVFVFFRIFSPTNFADQVRLRWYWHDANQGWVLQDTIPIKIVGGRRQGFRGFGYKSNFQPGEWKVEVDTTDEREIGRVYFSLDVRPESQRSFKTELM